MNLLLTGASGFIGRNLLLRAPGDWHITAIYRSSADFPEFVSHLNNPNITPVPCDLGDPAALDEALGAKGRGWDACLYLAGKVDIPWSVREPREDLLSSACPLLNLLELVRIPKFIYFSSGAVYGGLAGQVKPGDRFTPAIPYAISKLACEHYVRFFRERRNSLERYLIVRFFGAYGPYEAPHKIYTRLIRAFAFEGRDSYTIYGSGNNLIDAMYVDDAMVAIWCMLCGEHWDNTIDLAGGHPMTIEALVREAAAALGVRDVRIEKEGIAYEENRFWGAAGQMRDLFGFEPSVSLADGLTRFRDFLRRSEAATS